MTAVHVHDVIRRRPNVHSLQQNATHDRVHKIALQVHILDHSKQETDHQ